MNDRLPPESPQAWLERARSDLALARAALRLPDVLLEEARFALEVASCVLAWVEGQTGV